MDLPPQDGSNPYNPNQEKITLLRQLREQTHQSMWPKIAERKATNPTPTELELLMGAFEEELEPQIRGAVKSFYQKGYTTESSGFWGEGGQVIEGLYKLDDETIIKLSSMGVIVESHNSYTSIKFYPDNADLSEITAKWGQIADILSTKKEPAYASPTGGAVDFRNKYGNPITVERLILERNLANGYPRAEFVEERAEAEKRLERLKQIEQGMSAAEQVVKQKTWIEASDKVDKYRDGLGRPVDRGIKETLTAVNVLGFETRQSCEGHTDWGQAAPWIEIKPKGVNSSDFDLAEKAFDKLREADSQGKTDEELEILSDKAHSLREIVMKPLLEEANRLSVYLEEFYKDRRVPHDQILVIRLMRPMVESFRLESEGAILQEIADPKVKEQKLWKYQKEMNEFATFLKGKFFTSSTK